MQLQIGQYLAKICEIVFAFCVAQWLSGYWLAHLEFELEDPGSIPGSRHYSTG